MQPVTLIDRVVPALALALLLVGPAVARDNVVEYPSSDFFIEGVRAYCGDYSIFVHSEFDTLIEIPDISRIDINGPVFDSLPPGLRLFAFFQTCGMTFYDNDMAKADASAARVGAGAKWLSADDVEAMCTTDIMIKAGWEAAPDEARCAAIRDTVVATFK